MIIEGDGFKDRDKWLSLFNGNVEAYNLFTKLCYIGHIWDDLIDRDKPVDNGEINNCIMMLLVDLQYDSFYNANKMFLQPIVITTALEYILSQKIEGFMDESLAEISHILRRGNTLIVALMYLTGGLRSINDVGISAMQLVHPESLGEYKNSMYKKRK